MAGKRSWRAKSIALTLSLVLTNFCAGMVWAAPQVLARLMTEGGPARVDGNDAPDGSSLISGATIETPANVAATIQIGSLGTVELTPGSIIVLHFTNTNINVVLKQGCSILQTNKGTMGSITDSQGVALKTNSEAKEGVAGDPNYRGVPASEAKSDGAVARRLPVCGIIPPGSTVVSAAPAPAGAGAAGAGAAGAVLAGGGAAGLSTGAIGAIVAGVAGGAVVLGIIGTRGDNPSPSAP